jgi:hypothetical protein
MQNGIAAVQNGIAQMQNENADVQNDFAHFYVERRSVQHRP